MVVDYVGNCLGRNKHFWIIYVKMDLKLWKRTEILLQRYDHRMEIKTCILKTGAVLRCLMIRHHVELSDRAGTQRMLHLAAQILLSAHNDMSSWQKPWTPKCPLIIFFFWRCQKWQPWHWNYNPTVQRSAHARPSHCGPHESTPITLSCNDLWAQMKRTTSVM